LGEAKRTLEAQGKFCWVGAFSSGESAAPTPTLFFGPQGVRCAEAGKIILARRFFKRRAAVFFPPHPLTPKEKCPAPPRFMIVDAKKRKEQK
jgi:hypothetical protein